MNIPDTSFYMYLGYGVIFGVMLIYLVSLFVRFQSLNKDLYMLEQLEAKDSPQDSMSKNVSK